MHIKIGVQHVGREITLESDQDPQEVVDLVDQALTSGTVLKLADKKNNVLIIPAATIGYIELGKIESQTVGFGLV